MAASAAAVNAQVNPPLTAAERAARSVFVGNIPYEATEEQLKDIFAQVGPVVSFRLVYDRETGKPKGYGFCEYQDVETAQSAMRNLNNHDFNGRPLRVGVAAGEQNKDDMKSMQQAVGGAPVESPYGDPIEPEKAPEAISRAVASLPPEQMFELMKQMKLCIQNNPNEARNMLLQNPQLAYALLQAQIVMKIVDPQVAMAMLHRQTEAIPPLLPSANNGANDKPGDKKLPDSGPASSMAPPLSMASTGLPSMAGAFDRDPGMLASRGGLLGDTPGMGRMGPGLPPRPPFDRGLPMDIGPSGLPDMGMNRDQDMRGHPRDMGRDLGGPRGMGRDMGGRDMGPHDMGPRDMGMRDMDPRDMGRPGMLPPRSMAGPPDMGPRGAPPRDVRDPRGMGGDPRGIDTRGMDPRGMGGGPDPRDPRGMGDHRGMPDRPMGGDLRGMPPDHRPLGGDMGRPMDRDHRMGGDPRGMDPRGPGRGPPPASAGPPRSQPSIGGLGGALGSLTGGAGGQTQDKEKAALIMQVLQLSDQQIAMLPPDQRQSILILKGQISRSTGGAGPP